MTEIRSRKQDESLANSLETFAERPKRGLPHVKGGKIAEFGCGPGVVLSLLSKSFPESVIVGVDPSEVMLDRVNRRDLSNVVALRGKATDTIFPKNSFDSAIFISVLHEIWSFEGESRVVEALTKAEDVLKPGGRLIIEDFIRPDPSWVKVKFRNIDAEKRFMRFASGPKKIHYEKSGNLAEMDIGDCLEFFMGYKLSDPEWEEKVEEGESHFAQTMAQLQGILTKLNFVIEEVATYPFSGGDWNSWMEDVEVDFGMVPKDGLIVARKKSLSSKDDGSQKA